MVAVSGSTRQSLKPEEAFFTPLETEAGEKEEAFVARAPLESHSLHGFRASVSFFGWDPLTGNFPGLGLFVSKAS